LPGVPARTVTDVVHDATRFAASTAWHEIVVVPTTNCVPDLGEQLVETGSTPPLVRGAANVTFDFPLFPGAVTVSIVGQAIVSGASGAGGGGGGGSRGVGGGATVSAVTTTADEHDAVCLTISVAVQLNGVVPTLNSEPEAGVHPMETGKTPPLDTARRLTWTGFPSVEVRSGDGQEIDGALIPVRPVTSVEGGPMRPWLS